MSAENLHKNFIQKHILKSTTVDISSENIMMVSILIKENLHKMRELI